MWTWFFIMGEACKSIFFFLGGDNIWTFVCTDTKLKCVTTSGKTLSFYHTYNYLVIVCPWHLRKLNRYKEMTFDISREVVDKTQPVIWYFHPVL